VLIGEDVGAADPAAFDLPAGEFSKTIQEFMRQADVSVWYSSPNGSVKGIMTRAVQGVLSKSEALAEMLDGTGCNWTWESENSVLLRVNPDSSAGDTRANSSAEPPVVAIHSRDIQEVLVTFLYLRDVEASVTPMVRPNNQELDRTGFVTAKIALDALPMAIASTLRPLESARSSE
jgi:hypothetical protein